MLTPNSRSGHGARFADESVRRPRWRIPLVVSGLLLMGVAGLGLLWGWSAWTCSPQPKDSDARTVVQVRIARGMSLPAITDTLVQRGLLRHPHLFRLMARVTGSDRRLHAGRYAIPGGLAPRELLTRLIAGLTVPVRVMVPEGIEAEEAASLIGATLGFSPSRFLTVADSLTRLGIAAKRFLSDPIRLAQHDSLLAESASQTTRTLHWAEGYLAPDTYYFAEGTAALEVARVMVTLGLARADSVSALATLIPASPGLTTHELVTLASLVEGEARLAAERSMIAAVYSNRLRKGWRLEADPCVAYILSKRGQRLLYRDLEIDSRYNTYQRIGLPPGPIGNPGLAALIAAARPDSSCHALFFVADGIGGHVFSRTGAEHQEAVRRYRDHRREENR
ncbi:MAG: endolytic transglycosylase MltG [bacterium]